MPRSSLSPSGGDDDAPQLGNWLHDGVDSEQVLAKAGHRVAADGISPQQAIDASIACIKQILSE